MSIEDRIAERLEAAIDAKAAAAARPRAAMATGTVTRVDADGTVWARLAGSAGETPCRSTTATAKPGDVVTVEVGGGSARVVGNLSAPSTDDSTARAAQRSADAASGDAAVALREAASANGAATAANLRALAIEQHFYHDDDGAHIESDAGYRHDLDSYGSHVVDEDDGTDVARFGIGEAQIGKDAESHARVSRDGFTFDDEDMGRVFEVGSLGSPGGVTVERFATGLGSSWFPSIELAHEPSAGTAAEPRSIQIASEVYYEDGAPSIAFGPMYFVPGTASSDTVRSYDAAQTVYGTLSYDGSSFAFTPSQAVPPRIPGHVSARYYSDDVRPVAMTLGSRVPGIEEGAMSAAIGEGLIARELAALAVGRYNEDVQNAIFMVGTGNESTPITSFWVSRLGSIGWKGPAAGDTMQLETDRLLDYLGNGAALLFKRATDGVSIGDYRHAMFMPTRDDLSRGWSFATKEGDDKLHLLHKNGTDVVDTIFPGVPSTVTVSDILTPAAGISIDSAFCQVWGRLAMLGITYKRTSSISVPASGAVSYEVATVKAPYRPIGAVGLTSGNSSAAWASFNMNTSGVVNLLAMEGTGSARTVSASQTYYVRGVYIIA